MCTSLCQFAFSFDHTDVPREKVEIKVGECNTETNKIHRYIADHSTYDRSPLSLRANARSLGWMVTRFAWMAAKLVSSKRETRYASAASWRAMTAEDWKRRSV